VSIRVSGVTKRFGAFTAVDGVNVEVAGGELVALLGPSGSGKTTLLRLIAGLEIPDAGAIYFGEKDATLRPAQRRRVGFVFQHYALFRHMTVAENVAFGLRVKPRRKRPGNAEIKARVRELLEMVHLGMLADRYPSQLSGGQRQRVALARALAVRPKVLLLDEPFGALDARVRQDLRRALRKLHHQLGVTTIFVTHDQEEALELADRVVLMNRGAIEQVGTPQEVYDRPASAFVCGFLGDVNLFHSRIDRGVAYIAGVPVEVPSLAGRSAAQATVFVRPHALDVRALQDHPHQFRARIVHVNPAGALVKLELSADGIGSIRVEMPQEEYRALGLGTLDEVFVTPKSSGIFVPGVNTPC
jgi:sulfate/thiosulfate transport system ATP-binding protein